MDLNYSWWMYNIRHIYFSWNENFLQQRSFKILEVNLLLIYLLILANICPTTRGGNGWTEGSTCKFPFNYRGRMYDTCITLGENAPWCYTVDKPTRTTYGVPWGYCNRDSCPGGTVSYSIIHIFNPSGLKHFELPSLELEQLTTTSRSVRCAKSDKFLIVHNLI